MYVFMCNLLRRLDPCKVYTVLQHAAELRVHYLRQCGAAAVSSNGCGIPILTTSRRPWVLILLVVAFEVEHRCHVGDTLVGTFAG